jgi:heme exporter protein A
MPTLHADNLGQRFGSLLLFRRMSFTLEGGTSMAVTGANGSGKSTLLRILAGVLTPKAGSVTLTVNGTPVPDETHPRHTGLVAPYLNVYDDLTARENLQFLAQTRALSAAHARIQAVLDDVGLSGRGDDLVGTYSSGMTQRVKVAAALLAEPPLLLLDEPTTNLDTPGVDMVERVMAQQQDRGGVLVVATNRADVAAPHDRTICIEAFR